ncbi:hypothetical protein JNW89_24300 [Micromonospora sp. 4G55]|nr:hypothetical protein [Micromonospora sp. 4G55]MBM0259387.1 hypothetical protein [Micromonospora sp. 4G55]
MRYSRAPGTDENGCGTNRSAVSLGWCRYPRATPAPPTYSSPTTPAGTGFSHPSSTYSSVLAIGRPMGTEPSVGVVGSTSYAAQPTTVSVGPYSLTSAVPGAWARHGATWSARRFSPPMTKHRVRSASSAGLS